MTHLQKIPCLRSSRSYGLAHHPVETIHLFCSFLGKQWNPEQLVDIALPLWSLKKRMDRWHKIGKLHTKLLLSEGVTNIPQKHENYLRTIIESFGHLHTHVSAPTLHLWKMLRVKFWIHWQNQSFFVIQWFQFLMRRDAVGMGCKLLNIGSTNDRLPCTCEMNFLIDRWGEAKVCSLISSIHAVMRAVTGQPLHSMSSIQSLFKNWSILLVIVELWIMYCLPNQLLNWSQVAAYNFICK